LIILVQGWIIHSKAKAQIEGDVELLKTLAEKYRTNIDKLKTWKGEIQWFQKSTIGFSEWRATYACDFKAPAKRWAITIDKNTHIVDGKVISTPVIWSNGMFSEGAYYSMDYSANIKDSRHVATILSHPVMRPGFHSGVFDPEFFLGLEGNKFDEFCLNLYKNAKDATGCSIKKEGGNIVIRLAGKQDGPAPVELYNLYYIDLSQGSNVTRVELRTNGNTTKSETMYKWT